MPYTLLKNGEQVSKRRAAACVQKKFPEYSQLIENAFDWRAKHLQKNIDHKATFPEAKKLILFLIEQVKAKPIPDKINAEIFDLQLNFYFDQVLF